MGYYKIQENLCIIGKNSFCTPLVGLINLKCMQPSMSKVPDKENKKSHRTKNKP